ncbi:MAG TPA: phosphoribosylamine--glycine ligase [Chloroflexota bacterium]|nr:phosphoribosylamine--glycine ligase [Chloroflexota bacterium]
MVVGSGAREHALAWACARSRRVSEVVVAPGNGGTGPNVALDPLDGGAVARAAKDMRCDLVIVGSDDPLAAGVVDALEAADVPAFGPTQAAAQIEASKAWSKDFMRRHGIPTAPHETFDDARAAHAHLETQPQRIVVKADGLARGKGVIVCDTREEAHRAVEEIMERRVFGASGDRVVVEQRITGEEASVFALCDGETALPFEAARDYKRAYDGDRGPNTGGMGAYSPTRLVPPVMMDDVMARVVRPAVRGLAKEGRPFTGFLYAGLMFAEDGPQVIEFNARMGDPECQVILPRLRSDLIEAVEAAVHRRLANVRLEWDDSSACGVCLASEGYPDSVRDGFRLRGLDDVRALVFHAGTERRDGKVFTKGGRVVTVVGRGETLGVARDVAYHEAQRIEFEGKQLRSDIGARELVPVAA